MRRDLMNQVRGSLKIFGIVLGAGGRGRFDQIVRKKIADRAELHLFVHPLLEAWRALGSQLTVLDSDLRREARNHPVVLHLMTVPGVGAVTSVAFVAKIDDPNRFAKWRNVAANLGLTPRRYQSGEMDCPVKAQYPNAAIACFERICLRPRTCY